MAIPAGFPGRAFHRNTATAPSLADLLPAPGPDLRMRFEPRFAELVGGVVATLRVAGRTPVPVSDPHGRQWAPAYILGSLEQDHPLKAAASNTAVAEVVVDGSGRMVRNHPVQVIRGAHRLLPVSCPSLADRYEQFILAVRMGEEPRGDAMVLTRHGELMIAGPGQEPVALADYLNDLCRSAVGRAAAF
ncbi:hypothetical protein [Pseudarthrobacter sp. GA104]|uniref:hypothetical protein n=2 Tax=Micrococcales TaxID=85006 RepID=UPI0012FA291D|nr:hypothetical protein [Pseudarthrobacter sp. GA104]MUU70842.1 hypothetical protein [Pseudarthrobacter sp. GA104]